MKAVFDVRDTQIKFASIVKCYRTEINALDADCFRRAFDCILAPLADITT